MSVESGGTGDSKEKKASQYGGGWAKHAYGDEHPLSNRRQRRASKQELAAGRDRPARSLKKSKNRPGVPTRRHLIDRLSPLEKQISEQKKWLMEHVPDDYPPGPPYYYSSYKSHLSWLADNLEKRQKLIAEFSKYEYKLP